MRLPLTASQTVGPFFSIGLSHLNTQAMTAHLLGAWPSAHADVLTVEGRVLDGDGVPVPDVFLEIWHAAPDGSYASQDSFQGMGAACPGFARVAASPDGAFRFAASKPGPVAYDAERFQSPHLLVLLFMRGLLRNLVTRMYFPDDPANDSDPVLQLVPADRRATLIAQPSAPGLLRWNIILRTAPGSAETVFFAW